MLGVGLGGGHAVHANAAGLQLGVTALICPRHYELDTLAAAKAPTLCLFDDDEEEALQDAHRALLGVGIAAGSAGDFSSLRVPELRAELKSRRLPTKGRKAELIGRLAAASRRDELSPKARHLLLPSEGAALLSDERRDSAPGDAQDALLIAEGWLNAHLAHRTS